MESLTLNNNPNRVESLKMKAQKNHYVDASGRVPIDYAEKVKGADYYIGSWLKALKSGSIYSAPNGTFIDDFYPGETVGQIYSYVLKDGNVWWQLAGKNGNGTGGFVLHKPGMFDNQVALDTSSGEEHEQLLDELSEPNVIEKTVGDLATGVTDTVSGVGKTLSGIGKYLPLIILAVVVIAGYYVFTKKGSNNVI